MPTVVSDLRTVYRVHQTRLPSEEELRNPYLPYFTPVPAETGIAGEADAAARALELMREEEYEVGFILGSDYDSFSVHSLEPASLPEKQEIAGESRTGYLWEPAAPPRDDRSQALGDLQTLWRTSGGRRGLVIERERMERSEVLRLRLEYRERGVY
ncbi:MAG TPA: hypothetical protein VFU47_08175 [Armatimonadota bacterium]|nr:hypothetical protein [Armatimonadota bacterium]